MKPITFPLASGEKIPVPGSTWRHTTESIDTTHAQNIGVRCDGLAVIDCDTPQAADYWRSLDEYIPTYEVTTGKGAHFYYRLGPDDQDIGSVIRFIHDTDLKAGPGAYVVGAGSFHPNGAQYKASRDDHAVYGLPEIDDLPVVPPGVVDIARRRRQQSSSVGAGWSGNEWDAVPLGMRDRFMAGLNGYLRKQGASPQAMGALSLAVVNGMMEQPDGDEWGADDVVRVVRSMARHAPDPDETNTTFHVLEALNIISMAALDVPPPKSWLWKPYIPDTCTMLAGREKAGKGTFAAYIAAGVTRGEMPDGQDCEAKPVLWLAAEDHYHFDIWPRLRAAGWEPGKHCDVHALDPKQALILPEDMDILLETIRGGKYGLVVMDPGRTYIGDRKRQEAGQPISYNSEADIRPALQQLAFWSTDHRIPMLFVAHWRKGSAEGGTEDMTSGSAAWRQVLRHGIEVASLGSQGLQRNALWVGMSNVGERGFVRSYEIVANLEHDTAVFNLGDPTGHNELSDWIKETREELAGQRIHVFDPEDPVIAYVLEHVEVDEYLPARPALMALCDVSQSDVKESLAALRGAGVIGGPAGRPPARLK
jgi:hypothetical protein